MGGMLDAELMQLPFAAPGSSDWRTAAWRVWYTDGLRPRTRKLINESPTDYD